MAVTDNRDLLLARRFRRANEKGPANFAGPFFGPEARA
jgi:hypothetical protein